MFKAYASSQSSNKNEQEERKPIVTSATTTATNNNTSNETTWLENRSFSIESPTVSALQTKPSRFVVDVKPKEEGKKPINKPIQTTITKKTDVDKDIFYIDRRRDRANITVQYTHGIPRYGAKFCNQRPLGCRITKPRKQRIVRYFHQKFNEIDTDRPVDPFVTVDQRLEQLNTSIREHPQSFDAWKDLIDYQFFLFKTNGEQDKLSALFNKQFAIIDRALELNSNRLQYRLLKLNLRTQSHLFHPEILLKEWSILIKDCLKSSDDRTINETWFSYIQFFLHHIEIFSMEKLNDIFKEYFSTYLYHIQTRSDKGQRFLLNHMIDILQIWTYVLREGGFIERALGIYQTLIELHLDSSSNDFNQRLNDFELNWSKKKIYFGEHCDINNPVDYLDKELALLSENENRLFNSSFQSWLSIEQLRIDFYQLKIVNHGIHFHSELVRSLSDSSQIDNEILNISFAQFIRPFIFQIKDQREILQLIIYYLHFLNALPQSKISLEILQRLKISLSNHFHEQFFLEQELRSFHSFLQPIETIRSEERFSMEYISKVYEQLINIPILKSYQIDFILLYWYYLGENLLELRQQNPSLSKIRLKSLQTIIKKYLSLEEYRTCLRLYSHYARLEYEYFNRMTDARRVFDLCFQTIRTNPNNFSSFDSYTDLCHWLSTSLICEFRLNSLFNQMLTTILDNTKPIPLDQQINHEKLSSSINYVLNKLFPNMPFNDIITLVIQCLKSPKISKWDQTSEQDWSIYLRQNNSLSFELLFIFLNYSYLLHDPLDKLHQILSTSILPLINEQRNKNNQIMIDYLLQFYLVILWNELFTERLLFHQCTNYLKQLLDGLQWPSMILCKFISFYTCLLPLYGSYAKEFENVILSYRYNQKIEYRLSTKIIVLQMNFIRHLKIQKCNSVNEKFNSGYEHRVRRILRQLIQEYPFYLQLWKFQEAFERSSSESSRTKAVLYDAMQSCPWAKIFYLKSISASMDETEWKLFVNVMSKSNIHIFFSLEEFDMLKELFEMKS